MDAITEALIRDLDNDGHSTIVVPGAEGWRHCPPNVDLSHNEVRRQSRALTDTSLKRIEDKAFSPGEEAFFESEFAEEL